MNFDDVIMGRRSIRGYKAQPVPQKLIKEILDGYACAFLHEYAAI